MDNPRIHPMADRGSGGAAQKLDYRVLVATLQALQVASPAARAGGRLRDMPLSGSADSTPLADVLLGRRDWQEAVVAQGGSFNRFVAQARRAR